MVHALADGSSSAHGKERGDWDRAVQIRNHRGSQSAICGPSPFPNERNHRNWPEPERVRTEKPRGRAWR